MSPNGESTAQQGSKSFRSAFNDIRRTLSDAPAPVPVKRKYGLPHSKSVAGSDIVPTKPQKSSSLDDECSNSSNDIGFVSMYGRKEVVGSQNNVDTDEDIESGSGAVKGGERTNLLRAEGTKSQGREDSAERNLSGAVAESEGLAETDGHSNGNEEDVRPKENQGREDSNIDRDGILALAYNFLESRTGPILRSVAREWGVKQHTKKEFFVANFMVWLMDQQKEGRNVRSLLELKNEWGFKSFLALRELYKTKFRDIPNWTEIKSKGDPYRKKRDVFGHDNTKAIDLTLSEFARLMVLIRDDQDSRAAVLESRRSSTRPQLDAKVRKDSCWNDIVLKKFNDPEYHPFLDLTATFRDVDSRRPPVPPPKVGKDLLDAFNDAKKSFGVWYHKWHKSGHRDPEDYGGFQVDDDEDTEEVPAAAGNNDVRLELQQKSEHFRNFVPRSGPPKLQEEGQKALIIFVTLRCGTKQEDRELLSIFHRGMGGGKGDVQFESGLPGQDQEKKGDEGQELPRRKRRKVGKRSSRRGSSSSDSKAYLKSIQNSVTKLADNHAKALESQSSRINSTVVQDKIDEVGSEREAQLRQSEQVQKVLRLMAEAEDMMSKSKEGSPFYLMAKKQFESLQERCQSFMKDQQ